MGTIIIGLCPKENIIFRRAPCFDTGMKLCLQEPVPSSYLSMTQGGTDRNWPSSNFKIKKNQIKMHIQTDPKTDNIKINHNRTTLERSFKKLLECLNQIYWTKPHPLPQSGLPTPLGSQQGAGKTPIMHNVNMIFIFFTISGGILLKSH